MGNAHEAALVGKLLLVVGIGKGLGNEHEDALGAGEKERRGDLAGIAHAKPGVVLGVGEQLIERLGLCVRRRRGLHGLED